MNTNIHCEKCRYKTHVAGAEFEFQCTNTACECHTTTQKKKCEKCHHTIPAILCGCGSNCSCHNHFADASKMVAPTPSINEIINDWQLSDLIFLEINRAGTSAMRGTLNPEIHHRTIMKALAPFEANIRADEAYKCNEREETVHATGIRIGRAEARQSIYKELIDAIEGAKRSHMDDPDYPHDDCVQVTIFNDGLKIAAQIIKQKQEGA